MNNILKKTILLLCVSFFYISCDTVDFGDTNDNPNGPTAAVTSQLLTQAQKTVSTIGTSLTGTLFTQQITEGQYPGQSRYATLTYSYNSYYTGAIQNLNEIIKLNTDPETVGEAEAFGNTNNQIATAKILRAFILQFMTDSWGGLPWTEAFQGIDFPQPKFNTQEELYTIMFDEVEEAISLITTTSTGPVGDIIFEGDMSRWLVFANSLKMTLALRISDVNPTLAQTKFEEVITSGNYIKSNDENIEYNYTSDDAGDSPWHDRFKTREDYIMSEAMVGFLRENLDPRLFKYGEPARDSIFPNPVFPDDADAGYVGAPDGNVNGNVPSYSFPPSEIIYDDNTFPTPIYTSAQVKLSMAEAALRGWNVGETAETLFSEGITDSMTYWGVDEADITSYLSNHTSVTISDIAYEKYIALYLNGQEAWSEWRRLDAPTLTPSEYAADPRIPVRLAYDSSVQDNNSENYNTIISLQGTDNLHTKLWWDVN
ncbi:SusD/RagB family nutrient-binding outer membrane lipoprotein [Polaribacter sargassicola]|uniref:SusD/RagB family nutrient-binding outer membrane lipoprotein n=1 Tax=Polaribacter sargassicola TaxID=2836891 RepID=UPI001F2E00FB|nr:SusD/RagB family nutrient-binding outer membrane lipoprotein [Polaribacter sp. DS7-9]MCG1035701.1 SusD/RagB family nutrient-binding outer membrane lipoprotein [Polaribacter sp. DS7-9]